MHGQRPRLQCLSVLGLISVCCWLAAGRAAAADAVLARLARGDLPIARAGVTTAPALAGPAPEFIRLQAHAAFPRLSAELDNAALIQKAVGDPSMLGNLRGRVAEADWLARNAGAGWKPVASPVAPQNDAFRFVNGKLEGAQVKVLSNWRDYHRAMQKDHLAEYFVLPDDHYALVRQHLEDHRLGALRAGQPGKAAEFARQQRRLAKLGRNFNEVNQAVVGAAKYYKALKYATRGATFIAISLAILDGGMAIHEVATGKAPVDELVVRLGKTAVGTSASWYVAQAAAGAAVTAGATGAVPVAVAIVVGTATYLVVDWAIDAVADAVRITHLSKADVKRLFPDGARGVSLARLQETRSRTPNIRLW